jgi:WD40 repeat protein
VAHDRIVAKIVDRNKRKFKFVAIEPAAGTIEDFPELLGRHKKILDFHGDLLAMMEPASRGVEIRHTKTGELVKAFGGHSGERDAAFSSDGRLVAIVGAGRCTIYRLKDEMILCEDTAGKSDRVSPAVTFSPDGRWLAYAFSPRAIRVVDAVTWKRVADLSLPRTQGVRSLRFSEDSRTLLAVPADTDQPIHLWRLGEIRDELQAMGLARNLLFPSCDRSPSQNVPSFYTFTLSGERRKCEIDHRFPTEFRERGFG